MHRNKLLELQVFWDVMPCRLARLPPFRVSWCLHLQSQPVQEESYRNFKGL